MRQMYRITDIYVVQSTNYLICHDDTYTDDYPYTKTSLIIPLYPSFRPNKNVQIFLLFKILEKKMLLKKIMIKYFGE